MGEENVFQNHSDTHPVSLYNIRQTKEFEIETRHNKVQTFEALKVLLILSERWLNITPFKIIKYDKDKLTMWSCY